MKLTQPVEEIYAGIEKYKYLSSRDLATLRSRWFKADRKEVDDPESFRRWLVLNQYVTDFVAKVLSSRKADQLVLNQYRLIDLMATGAMAGAYLAIDPLDRHVAIEVLSADSAADKAVLTEFQQAAYKAMVVNHPNVGRILDTGEAHGHYYLVKEYYEGQTLEEILQKRGKLDYPQAARLMALALAGVEALHAAGVPAGDLTADCIMLAAAGGSSPKQRTVKVLHAGVKRKLFDETAIGRTIMVTHGIPDELELAHSTTFQIGRAGAPNRADDLFHLGCVFYQCVTGQVPYRIQDLPEPQAAARPVCQVAPEVPEMLGQIIDEMIAPVAADRPQKAAHVAKSLRVFLAADEDAREVKAEEQLVMPRERPVRAPARNAATVQAAEAEADDAEAIPLEDDEADDDAEEAAEPVAPKKRTLHSDSPLGKAAALWQEVGPTTRDLLFVSGGAVGTLILILLGEVLTGLRMSYLAGLITGGAATYVVELFLRWRREVKPTTD